MLGIRIHWIRSIKIKTFCWIRIRSRLLMNQDPEPDQGIFKTTNIQNFICLLKPLQSTFRLMWSLQPKWKLFKIIFLPFLGRQIWAGFANPFESGSECLFKTTRGKTGAPPDQCRSSWPASRRAGWPPASAPSSSRQGEPPPPLQNLILILKGK